MKHILKLPTLQTKQKPENEIIRIPVEAKVFSSMIEEVKMNIKYQNPKEKWNPSHKEALNKPSSSKEKDAKNLNNSQKEVIKVKVLVEDLNWSIPPPPPMSLSPTPTSSPEVEKAKKSSEEEILVVKNLPNPVPASFKNKNLKRSRPQAPQEKLDDKKLLKKFDSLSLFPDFLPLVRTFASLDEGNEHSSANTAKFVV